MPEQSILAFRLPSNLPALSAARIDDTATDCPAGAGGFAAVDGQKNAVYLFTSGGVFTESVETVRPYDTICQSATGGTYLAGSRCPTRNRAYLLNCRFEEIGSIDLQAEGNDCEDTGCLMDLSPASEGGEARIYATFRKTVRLFDYGGEQLRIALRGEKGRENLHYAVSGPARALHFRKNGTEFVNIAEMGAAYLGIVPSELRLRGFLPSGVHDLYGLFGYRYLYNYLIPLYRNGVFLLPANGEIDRILRSLCSCP